MTLTDPREALADQSNFISCLVGLAGLGRTVHTLAEGARRSEPASDSDDFLHILLGLASLGKGIERLANSALPQPDQPIDAPAPSLTTMRWLR